MVWFSVEKQRENFVKNYETALHLIDVLVCVCAQIPNGSPCSATINMITSAVLVSMTLVQQLFYTVGEHFQ